jgi:hypothetical protein
MHERPNRLGIALGLCYVGVLPGLVLIGVFAGNAAELLIAMVGTAFPVLSFFANVLMLIKQRSRAEPSPWTCKTCGYLLVGLKEHRCPECGTVFDPDQLAATPLTRRVVEQAAAR